MKSLEYIKAFMEEKVEALKQVEANPQNFDEATKIYAKRMAQDAIKWHEEALKEQKDD